MNRNEEIQLKLGWMRAALLRSQARALRLKGSDWFFWATAGSDNTVLLAAETGIAEVLVTAEQAWVLTNEIEAERLKAEQAAPGFEFHVAPWAETENFQAFITRQSEGGKVLCDRPVRDELPLDNLLWKQRLVMTETEISRYRNVGLLASEAMSEVLMQAKSHWSELALAGAAAECLWTRGLHPALILAAGSQRVARYRHPLPTAARLDAGAMLVFCARGYGLYANLTRFVNFAPPAAAITRHQKSVMEIEAVALEATRPGRRLSEIYQIFSQQYARVGHPEAIKAHHQGGLTGYLAREAIAQPSSDWILEAHNTVAWNPSLPGAKIEDTFLLGAHDELENLTFDSAWPHTEVAGRMRPVAWQA